MAKFLKIASGRMQEEAAVASSAGAGDAGKVPQLDSTGRLDVTMMPVGFGEDIATYVASENLTAGDFVNIWNDSGTAKARKADATSAGKEADGFVLSSYLTSATATVYFEGPNTQLTSLTPGARYYLATTAGTVTSTPPSATGNVLQYIGRATASTKIAFEASEGVILA